MTSMPFPIAIAQLPITGDAHINGAKIRDLMRQAAASGARLIQFPEGALSGYAKNPIQDWSEVLGYFARGTSVGHAAGG